MIKQFIKNNWPVFFWIPVYLCIAGAMQLILHPSGDTPYHVAVGRLISEHGILHSFPWTPFSWLADNYADDRFLFHAMFVPFADLPWATAARIVGALAGTVILTTFYLIARAERVRFAGLWTLVALVCSSYFIYRFMLVRPHLLSIALALIFLWSAARGRLRILAAVSFIYPWTYIAFWQIPILLLIAAEAAQLLAGNRARWKPAAVAAAGIAAGVAVHPNAVNLLNYNWIVMSDVLFKNAWAERIGFNMGSELAPYPPLAWAIGLMVVVFMTIVAAIYAWRNRRENGLSLAFTAAALGFCALTIKSGRFVEYYAPFSAASLALASRSISWRFLTPVVLGVSVLYSSVSAIPVFMKLLQEREEMPRHVVSSLREEIPRGSRVFTGSWDYTGLLLVTLPEREFLVALDPTLFYVRYPKLYELWYRLVHEAPEGTARTIRQKFGARYVIIKKPKPRGKIIKRLRSNPNVETLVDSRKWLLFDLGEPSEANKNQGS